MTEFERQLVHSFNVFFKENGIKGIAFRLKQHRFTHQYLDVIVDSLHPDYYLGIECKSISTHKGARSLYFKQHFTVDKHGSHQIERMLEYLRLSGRKGFLAVELRSGTGKERTAYAIPMKFVTEKFEAGESGFKVKEIMDFPRIERTGAIYIIDAKKWVEQNPR
ncbi:MAG: hypothetical protein ACNYWM_00170 [Methanosarcinales archaeon]|jgi:hypothetical protein|nr:hypothetical protein [Methanosarcinales archaeon]